MYSVTHSSAYQPIANYVTPMQLAIASPIEALNHP